jgi:hypothetical protein
MRVLDGTEMEDALGPVDIIYNLFSDPPRNAPPPTARLWREAAERCKPFHAQCPTMNSEDDACAKLRDCTQGVAPALRESWLRELGASAWVHAIAGAVDNESGMAVKAPFFAKAWGFRPCELGMRELRVGQESPIMMVGSDAPLPDSLDAAAATAGELSVRIAKGEGPTSPRALQPWHEASGDDAARALGCDRK